MHKLLLDLEGGDEVGGVPMLERAVLGAVKAVQSTDGVFIGIGNEEKAQRVLEEKVTEDFDRDRLKLVDVTVDSEPAETHSKRLTEAIVEHACAHLKDGIAEGFYTCGNTQHVLPTLVRPALVSNKVEKFPGIRKPYLIAQMPASMVTKKKYFLCDVGATRTHDLRTYKQIVSITKVYAKVLFNEDNPRIGILSNGVEPTKGDSVMRVAREALGIEFVEPEHLYAGEVSGAAVSGVMGNIILKVAEETCNNVLTDLCALYLPKCSDEEKAKFMQTLKELKKWYDPDEQGVAFFGGFKHMIGKGHGESSILKYANGALNVYKLLEAGASEEIGKLLEE